MSHIVFNLLTRLSCKRLVREAKLVHHTSLPFSISRQLIAKGLLIALLGTLMSPVSAQPPIAPTGTQTQETSESNAVAKQLLGQWQAKDPSSDETFTFIFAPEGNLFVLLPSSDGSSVALKGAYQINSTTQPMQLDILLSDEQKALTIFEFTPEGQLRLALEGLTPGLPRPTQFPTNATLFEKTSETTTVSEDIKVVEMKELSNSSGQSRKPEDEAKTYMYALTKVQQAHYQEVGKFATAIEEVSIGLKTETESYRYQIVPQGDEKQSVMVTAQAKNTELPSYTGVVFVTRVNGEATTVAQICETESPSTSPPAMPEAPARGSSAIQCPAGSRSLQ